MFNGGDNRGFDLINHAIRMGTMGEVLRRNDLLLQLNTTNPVMMGRQPGHQQPPQHQHQHQHQHPLAQSVVARAVAPSVAAAAAAIASRQNADRLNPNAFQFPWKLHDMLDNAASDGFEYVVSWQEDGRSFRVHKPPKFVEAVMPIYFKQTKYKSFQRQLNLYGFTRINEGPAKGGYRHKYFVRGQRSLCQLITRSSTADAPVSSSTVEPSTTSTYDAVLRTAHHQSNVSPLLGEHNASAHIRESTVTVTSSSNNSATTETSRDHVDDDRMDDAYKALIHKEFQFPWKLHEMLEKSSIDAFEHIVCWQPGEVCFKVHDPQKFVNLVMPRFFKQTKYKSFQRQLNLYGFIRIDEGPNKGAYRHKCFVKGRKDLLNNMSRQKIRGEKFSGGSTEEPPVPEKAASQSMDTESPLSPNEASQADIPAMLTAIKFSEGSEGEATDDEEEEVKESPDGLSWRQNPSESFSDWTVEVIERETQKKEIHHVHRRVLAVGPRRSEYFARLFKMNSSNKNVLQLGSVEANVFPLVLDHMYADVRLHLNAQKAYALYSLAEQLEISSVLQAATDFYRKHMTKENVVDFLQIAETFHDKTLLEAAVDKCAEEMRSMEQATAAKLKPEVLLQVLLKSKTLPRSYKCGSSHLSQFVAECVRIHSDTLTWETFQRLTGKEQLPYIESIAAIKLLAAENKLLNSGQGSPDISLHERCVFSIAKHWEELRSEMGKDEALSDAMKSVSPAVMYEILMKTTDHEPSE